MHQDLSNWSHLWESGNYQLVTSTPLEEDGPSNWLIYDIEKHAIVRIEDDALFTALVTRMYESGVPILRRPPAGESIVDGIVQMVSDQRSRSISLNTLLKEANLMEKAGCNQAEIMQRMREIIDTMRS